jgi:NhaA family Na+:H+ antiporter
MATDIAFAVGVLVLLGPRIPKSVMAFLVGLAIVDDLGAVVVIALFYTEQIYISWLALAMLSLILLVLFNRFGIRKPLPYFIVGVVMWFTMLQSGVHATLSGVLVALTIPVKPKFDHKLLTQHMSDLVDTLRNIQNSKKGAENDCIIHDSETRGLLQTIENGIHSVESPLQRLEHALHLPVAFLVIPLFALANAGIPVEMGSLGQTLTNPVALGVMFGLVLGKLIGVAGLTWLAVKLGFGQLPEGMTFKHLVGIGLVSGIGFTMSIFISELAFAGQADNLLMAKTGVLFASLIAGIGGYLWFLLGTEKNNK